MRRVVGGVGFDINCGVRLIRTNLSEKDVAPHKEELAQKLFDSIPVGVGSMGVLPVTRENLSEVLVCTPPAVDPLEHGYGLECP